jgi:hypothetical protein
MDEKAWLSLTKAAALVRDRLKASIGRSEAIVRQAIASDEVRTLEEGLLTCDDGMGGTRWLPGGPHLSAEDLLDWLDRNRAPTSLPIPQQQQRGHAGVPAKHDWDALEQKFWELWEKKGDFRKPENQMLGWNSRASAARTLLGYIKKGRPPDPKTIEDYIGRWLRKRGV